MSVKMDKKIPQIISIVPLTAGGRIGLRKIVRQYLNMENRKKLYLEIRDEVLLSAEGQQKDIVVFERNSISIPESVRKLLQIERGCLIALVEREKRIALKSIEIKESNGEQARWTDFETPFKIIRKVERNPMPEKFSADLPAKYGDLKLKYDIRSFLKGRQTFEALLARQKLGIPDKGDDPLIQELIKQKYETQQSDGSWSSELPRTAGNLKVLADLGLTIKQMEIRKAVNWLIDRPQSEYIPGLWFTRDELVREQTDVIKLREQHTGKGAGPRLHKGTELEEKLVCSGDPVITDPCGPRILWSSALVLEALLSLGLEGSERVQTALNTLAINPHWCDNTYKYGLSAWKRKKPVTLPELEMAEKYYVNKFLYGGISYPMDLKDPEMLKWFPRITSDPEEKGIIYRLKMPFDTGEGCRIFMSKVLSNAGNEIIKKIINVYVWEYAGSLNFTEERITRITGYNFTDRAVFLLQFFSRSGLPASRLVITRMLPWIVNSQNKDGSWGWGNVNDISTLAVLDALICLGRDLPEGIRLK